MLIKLRGHTVKPLVVILQSYMMIFLVVSLCGFLLYKLSITFLPEM